MARSWLLLLLLLMLLMLLNTSAASIEDFSLDAWCPDAAKRFDVRQFGAVGNGVGNDGKLHALCNAMSSDADAYICCPGTCTCRYNPRDQWDEHLSAGRSGPSSMAA
jgi:hypothetical protein